MVIWVILISFLKEFCFVRSSKILNQIRPKYGSSGEIGLLQEHTNDVRFKDWQGTDVSK